jgi:hypothetical protein
MPARGPSERIGDHDSGAWFSIQGVATAASKMAQELRATTERWNQGFETARERTATEFPNQDGLNTHGKDACLIVTPLCTIKASFWQRESIGWPALVTIDEALDLSLKEPR